MFFCNPNCLFRDFVSQKSKSDFYTETASSYRGTHHTSRLGLNLLHFRILMEVVRHTLFGSRSFYVWLRDQSKVGSSRLQPRAYVFTSRIARCDQILFRRANVLCPSPNLGLPHRLRSCPWLWVEVSELIQGYSHFTLVNGNA